MFLHHSYCSWWKVHTLGTAIWTINLTALIGFNQFTDEADVGKWTGILGLFPCLAVSAITLMSLNLSCHLLPHTVHYISPMGKQFLHLPFHAFEYWFPLGNGSNETLTPSRSDHLSPRQCHNLLSIWHRYNSSGGHGYPLVAGYICGRNRCRKRGCDIGDRSEQ